MKTALITGATSGIGKSTAIEFAKMGIHLVLCGRRADRLLALSNQLKDKVAIHALNFDVRRQNDVVEQIKNLPEKFRSIDILVNNAGNAHGLDPIQSGNIKDWDAMIDINIKGLLYVSKAIIPGMTERGSGHIINIGSIAGKEVYPNGNVYCASKHAVDAISKSMLMDLNAYGIKVSAINPGLVETEFSKVRFKGDDARAENVYKGFTPLKPEDIAAIIAFVVSRPYHVNISDLVVLPSAQANSTIVNKSL